jgi:hypothetical protein
MIRFAGNILSLSTILIEMSLPRIRLLWIGIVSVEVTSEIAQRKDRREIVCVSVQFYHHFGLSSWLLFWSI